MFQDRINVDEEILRNIVFSDEIMIYLEGILKENLYTGKIKPTINFYTNLTFKAR